MLIVVFPYRYKDGGYQIRFFRQCILGFYDNDYWLTCVRCLNYNNPGHYYLSKFRHYYQQSFMNSTDFFIFYFFLGQSSCKASSNSNPNHYQPSSNRSTSNPSYTNVYTSKERGFSKEDIHLKEQPFTKTHTN